MPIRLTAEYKWTHHRVVNKMYTIFPPEVIRRRCGVNYEAKIFPDLKEELISLNVDVSDYPTYHGDSEEQADAIVNLLNKKWKLKLEQELDKKNGI